MTSPSDRAPLLAALACVLLGAAMVGTMFVLELPSFVRMAVATTGVGLVFTAGAILTGVALARATPPPPTPRIDRDAARIRARSNRRLERAARKRRRGW